jgi:large subunit ribosomal protein L10
MGEKTQKIQQYKREAVASLRDSFRQAPGLIFTDYRGLTVAQITDLRRALRKQSAEFKVVKNNYAKIAMAELGLPFEEGFLTNPTAVALARTDIGPVAKTLFDFARESPLKVKGGMVDGQALRVTAVEAISRLPGRLELLAILLGTMNAPLRNLMYVMKGVSSKLVRTLQAVADKKVDQKADVKAKSKES